ncbi:cysteine desulfurase family protein [Blattabacterium cuenoti]|uniref:cysteine desulfurase family protein n=1 Tax=Blattabacterium cuenoti TaxID=1653831 RepID=UPI00163B6817|nr:cysteine desulfurase family protein [Blattabacterium cuenoti]
MKRVYLDNASTTPIKDEVIKSMVNVLRYSFGNPSSIQHHYGRKSRSIIEESRICIANIIHADPSEIIFTSGGTEGNNLAIQVAISDLKVEHIITSKLEHFSVLKTILDLYHKDKISVSFISFDKKGIHDLNHMENILNKFSSKKVLVSLMYVNNEIGNILEIKKVIEICKKYNAYFHSDAIQAIGNIPINVKSLLFDFATVSAHKIYGPKGIGFIFIRKNLLKNIKSFIIGGSQEHGIRSGTENIYGIVGMAKAIELSIDHYLNYKKKMQKLKLYCISKLKEHIPNILFNGLSFDTKKSVFSIINLLFPVMDHLLYFRLDIMGISISKGSTCIQGTKSSHVIQSITNHELLKKMMPIRISLGFFNEKKDIDLLIHSLKKIIKQKNVL